jgi:hypothetical protein
MTNPVEWAEKDLGAQQVWDESQSVTTDLQTELRVRDAFAGELRVHQSNLDEAEYLVAERTTAALAENGSRVVGKAPSQAAIDRAVKTAIVEDKTCASLRTMIRDTRINLDGADSRVEGLKIRARALTARMELVAQQLAFYASCKNAETAARNQLVGSPASRWPY